MCFMVSLFILWIAFELYTTIQYVKAKIKTTNYELQKVQHSLLQLKNANLETSNLIQQQLSTMMQQVEILEPVDDKVLYDKFELIVKLYENTLTTYSTIWQKL